ncbi:DEKNAAC101335 [Brettanomyces naardenensis]|uniref:DEKNAAC101335 n=1 Tax=Brettanomyces naardenensis TaxID=13370 RepID=A0A448YHM3_BRENA|nr:DEKNAAC101335 [Brettanomyces naardenensis]
MFFNYLFLLLNLVLGVPLSSAGEVSDIALYAYSGYDEINGLGIYNIHEGAGINYLFLGQSAATLFYNKSTDVIFQKLTDKYNQYLAIAGGIVELAVYQPDVKFTVVKGNLAADGSADGFYACKNTGDPYGYSKNQYQVLYNRSGSPAYDSCKPISIGVKY